MGRTIILILFGLGIGLLITGLFRKVQEENESPERIIDNLEERLKSLEMEFS